MENRLRQIYQRIYGKRICSFAVGEMDYSLVKAVCIGKQTRAAADAMGMQTWMAAQATMDAVIELLETLSQNDSGR